MTLRVLPRSRLDRVIPPLVRNCALVALVPITDDPHWAAGVAWNVARASAASSPSGRRAVALVDLGLEAPTLHDVKQLDPAPGIAEAITADVSLNEVARDVEGVNFVPTGSDVPDPVVVRGSARWRRLQAGFRNEGALLLVYLPAERLEEFGTAPDGVLALAANGVDLGSAEGRALLAARERGIELLGVVRERWSTAATAPSGTTPRSTRPMIVAAVAVVAVGGAAILATAKGAFHIGRAPTNRPANQPAAAAPAPGVVLPILAPVDSGAWTLQLAAYGAPERALAHADRLGGESVPALVSPLAPDASGAVWYRVQTGVYASRAAALAARAGYWRRGITARGEGKPLLAPYSLALLRANDGARLRALGFTGLRWGPHGPVLVGAFEHPEQAVIAQAQLDRAGIPTTLLTRTERTP